MPARRIETAPTIVDDNDGLEEQLSDNFRDDSDSETLNDTPEVTSPLHQDPEETNSGDPDSPEDDPHPSPATHPPSPTPTRSTPPATSKNKPKKGNLAKSRTSDRSPTVGARLTADDLLPPNPLAAKRGPGRPPKQREPLPEEDRMPAPPAFNAEWSEAEPYWRGLGEKQLKMLIVRLYRLWPIIDRHKQKDEKTGKPKKTKYIAKYQSPISIKELLFEWGSGDYKLMFNIIDTSKPSNQQSKNIMNTYVWGLRDPEYPPVLEAEDLVLDDPQNQSYIAGLRQKGMIKTDEQAEKDKQQGEDDMATAEVAKELTGMLREQNAQMMEMVADRAARDDDRPEDSAAPIRVMASAAEASIKLVADSVARSEEARGKVQDPTEMFRTMVSTVKELMPATDNTMVLKLMEREDSLRTELNKMQEDRIKSTEKLLFSIQDRMDKQAESFSRQIAEMRQQQVQVQGPGQGQPAGVAGISGDPAVRVDGTLGKLESELDRMVNLKTKFDQLTGGGGDSGGGGGGWAEKIIDNLPIIMMGINGLASMFYNFKATSADQLVKPPALPPEYQEMVNQHQPEMQGQGGQGQGVQGQQQQGGGQGVDPYLQFLNEIEVPIIQHLNLAQNQGQEKLDAGNRFAAFLIQQRGLPMVRQIQGAGADALVKLMQRNHNIWNKMMEQPQLSSAFITQFLGYQPGQPAPAPVQPQQGQGQGTPAPAPAPGTPRRVVVKKKEGSAPKIDGGEEPPTT